jgi:hypothetical protein
MARNGAATLRVQLDSVSLLAFLASALLAVVVLALSVIAARLLAAAFFVRHFLVAIVAFFSRGTFFVCVLALLSFMAPLPPVALCAQLLRAAMWALLNGVVATLLHCVV